MNVQNLTPPVQAKPKAEKAPKEPKVKKERKPVDPNAPRMTINRQGIIRLVPDKEIKYRGQRLEWWERIKPFIGKTVTEFGEANKGIKNGKGTVQPPGGWLSFYVRDGRLTIENPPAAEEQKPAA